MSINNYINQIGKWLDGSGPYAGIVFSSRIRLARNINQLPFSHWANAAALKKVAERVMIAVPNNQYMKGAEILELDELSTLDKEFLVERHLISPESVKGKGELIVIGDKELVSVMVNEEDHLRIQAMASGLQLSSVWRYLDQIDDKFSQELDYAISPEWGYLTACPTNVGTGIRASVMIHLPAIAMTKQIDKLLKAVSQLGLAIRGIHGEGTEALGNLFQISNQVTLGRTEEEITDNIERVSKQIIEHEEKAQALLLKEAKTQVEDRVFRAYAILTSARIVTSKEAINLFSLLRLGVNIGLVEIDFSTLNEIFILSQPAHIRKRYGQDLSQDEQDVRRADLIREKLTTAHRAHR
ncbi:MAG: protein arginine kinase [bacterium]